MPAWSASVPPGEQEAGGAGLQGLREVDDGHVEPLGRALEPAAGVLVPELGARVFEGAPMHLGEMGPAGLDDAAVDVHHDGSPDRRIAEDLTERRPLPAPDDQRAFGVGMEDHGRVDQGLVVDEVVGDARLDAPVQNEALAVARRLEDLHLLELGAKGKDRPDDRVRVALDRRRGLKKPFVGTLLRHSRRRPP
jgi:hypothetical protein